VGYDLPIEPGEVVGAFRGPLNTYFIHIPFFIMTMIFDILLNKRCPLSWK
jgi:hypothetical protein